jgi:hypothetical protein
MATASAKTKKKTAAKKTTGTRKKSAKKHAARKTAKKSSSTRSSSKKSSSKKWSKHVNETSDAMDLESGVFKKSNPKKIAKSLKRSSTSSKRKKGTPYQSAMSMLNFYINRGGKNLSATQKKTLEKAKKELRKVFHRDDQ